MNKRIKSFIAISAILFSALSSGNAYAQQTETIVIDPLFEYPQAPEEMTSLVDKSNYLVDHFWDSMNFKNKSTVDQNALNDAFHVYSVPMRWADKARSLASADKLVEKVSKSPTLLLQFTKAAEENIYGPRAEVWIDEVYMKFLEAIVKNKKINDARKNRYRTQLTKLKACVQGEKAPEFTFTNFDGKEAKYFPMSTVTMLIFGDPNLFEWRMSRLKMESNTALSQAVDKGKLNIMFINLVDKKDWQNDVSNYSTKWTVGSAPSLREQFDFRTSPSIYLVGSDGKILMKNVAPENAIFEALQQIEKPVEAPAAPARPTKKK